LPLFFKYPKIQDSAANLKWEPKGKSTTAKNTTERVLDLYLSIENSEQGSMHRF
jgi:P pilus assembly chaperone PapD